MFSLCPCVLLRASAGRTRRKKAEEREEEEKEEKEEGESEGESESEEEEEAEVEEKVTKKEEPAQDKKRYPLTVYMCESVTESETSPPSPSFKWQIVCSTAEEWEQLVDTVSTLKTPTAKKLHRALDVSFTSHVLIRVH